MKGNVGMISMTLEKVGKQGRDIPDRCVLSHKTALHTVWLAGTIVQHLFLQLEMTIIAA